MTNTTRTVNGNSSAEGVIDARELRRCLAQFATGVTVVGCRSGNSRHGATVNAFTAVSLDPPLILVAVDRRSRVCAYLRGRPFSVTVLASGAHEVALHFAGRTQACPRPEWVESRSVPRLAGGVAWLACRPWASCDGGDHVLYLGEVQDFSYQRGSNPLLFHSGLFRSFGTSPCETPWLGTLDSPESTVGWRMPLSAACT
jgi:flavin reductase (DIM6/NTAB) family NADH-FMN oxidoreductase RutF